MQLILAKIIGSIIRAYQAALSPMLGQRCRYYPSCSEYVRLSFEKHSTPTAARRSVWRLLRCTPFHAGGIDLP